MRNYLILKEKARRFNEDTEIQSLLAEIRSTPAENTNGAGAYVRARADSIKASAIAKRFIGMTTYSKPDSLRLLRITFNWPQELGLSLVVDLLP